MRLLYSLFILLALFNTGCDSAGFGGGSDKTSYKPKPKTPVKTATQENANSEDAQGKTEDAPDTAEATPTPEASKAPKPTNTVDEGSAVPPVGPGSELTLVINDRDSKMDVFRVRNAAGQTWVPLTWSPGTQTVPGACSPHAKTVLTLEMHSRPELLHPEVDYKAGSCNAPLTQTAPNSVSVGINPLCAIPKASFTLSCSGSATLQVVP